MAQICVAVPRVGHIAVGIAHRQCGSSCRTKRHVVGRRNGRGLQHRHLQRCALAVGVVGGHIVRARIVGRVRVVVLRAADGRVPVVVALTRIQRHIAAGFLAEGRRLQGRHCGNVVYRHRQGNQRAAAVVAVGAGHIEGGGRRHVLCGGVQDSGALHVAVPRLRVAAARRRQRHCGRTAVLDSRGRELVVVVVHRRYSIGHRGETAVLAQRAHVVGLRGGHARTVGRARGRIRAAGVDKGVGRALGVKPVGRARGRGRQGYLTRAATGVARGTDGRVGLVGHRHVGGLAFATIHHIRGSVGGAATRQSHIQIAQGRAFGVFPRQGIAAESGGKGGVTTAGVDRGGNARGVNRLTDRHRHSLGRADTIAVGSRHIVGGVGRHVHIH